MDHQFAADGNAPRPAVPDFTNDLIELYESYLNNPGNADIEEQFLAACTRVLRKKIDYRVVFLGNGPKFLARGTFADDVFSLALVKFWAGIRSIRTPERLNTWLSRVASSALYDELRQFTRRKNEGHCEWETIETMRVSEDGNIVDEEMRREFAERNDRSGAASDEKQLIQRDILQKVFNDDGSKEKKPDWQVLELSAEFTIDEMAERLGTSKPHIRYRLKRSRRAFRLIATKRYRFNRRDI